MLDSLEMEQNKTKIIADLQNIYLFIFIFIV